jgi:hypothetical protein
MKRLAILVIILNLFFIGSIYAQVPSYVPTNGLAGWWPFNGNANDESGNGHNGIINGGITLTSDRFDNTNKAYYFNGNTSGFIEIPDHNDLSFTNNQFTFAFWMFPDLDVSAAFRTILSKYSASNGREYMFLVPKDEAAIIAGFSSFVNGNDCPVYSDNAASTIRLLLYGWSQYIITGDGNVLNAYLNGTLVSTINRNYNCNLENTSNSLWIGKSYQTQKMKGSLDDIGIWNRALTAQEITTLYSRNIATGLNETTLKNSVQLYPNPSKNKITISNANMINTVKVVNIFGDEILTKTNNSKDYIEIDLSNLKSGIYFAKLINNKDNIIDVKKIVLQ